MSTPETAAYVTWSVDAGVATVNLHHPNKPNPLDLRLQQQLLTALRAVEDCPDARALLLRAEGKAFCVGADLAEMEDAQTSQPSLGMWTAGWMAAWLNPIVLALQGSRMPVVCAVRGAAAGAGAGLAMSSDVLLMAASSYLLLPFVPRLGLLPDMGCTWFLPRRVGTARATAIALLGDRIGAEEAVRLGIAWQAIADDAFEAQARQFALRLAALPPGAAPEVRRAFAHSQSASLAEQLLYETGRQRELADSAAFAEGMRAFREKRAPVFSA